MTAKKYVAGTLTSIPENQMVKDIFNRKVGIHDAIIEALTWWDYDLFNRKPSPAYDEYGVFKGTNLDLACFMYALAGRGAVINIPEYKASTVSKKRADQVISSKSNRNGSILGVVSNKDFFSFSVKILDQNVIGEDSVGDARAFSLTDKEGNWYEGWKTIQFVPTLKENRFITDNSLWSGSRIIFKNFIHPNRWTSFFGQHYVITKLLIDRLEEESSFLNKEMKRLKAAGVEFPEGEGPKSYIYESTSEKGVSKQFTSFVTKIHVPESNIINEYTPLKEEWRALVTAYKTRQFYQKALSKLRFMTRATEYAHFKNQDRMPAWLKNVKWESGFREPKKRTDWDRLKLVQTKVGENSISILKRQYQKSTIVSEYSA